jgi:hypothetical protein
MRGGSVTSMKPLAGDRPCDVALPASMLVFDRWQRRKSALVDSSVEHKNTASSMSFWTSG